MHNRLGNESSPYLLQHRHNPIDWYPWGEEAFRRAKAEDKPVFLSVGYSACHWCHVMAHESFEDQEVATALNEGFVSIKVDREERPDVDEAYMAAVQLGTGRGGWPMSLFLTPDKRPFFGGTYFPRRSAGQRMGFLELIQEIKTAWLTNRNGVEEAAQDYASALTSLLGRTRVPPQAAIGPSLIANAIEAIAATFDSDQGGFGGAPKFPPHSALMLLLQVGESGSLADRRAQEMALYTLSKIARGGIHDHIGGGFHRYSTDDHWLVPHFEKMLYDNALLLESFSVAARVESEEAHLYGRAAQGIVEWLLRDMTDHEGLLASALDADSEGEEGRYYVWHADEVRDLLGREYPTFASHYGVREEGNFTDEATGRRTGTNILHWVQGSWTDLAGPRSRLLEARSSRTRPGLDHKAILAWNGMAIRGLVAASVIEPAMRCADRWLEIERQAGYLPHQVTNGVAAGPAFLEDIAWLIDGLLCLDEHVPADGYRQQASRLCMQMVAEFLDEERGLFMSTSNAHEELFGRSVPVYDQATPSASAVAIRCLVRLGEYREAVRILESASGWMQGAPQATTTLNLVLFALLAKVPDAFANTEHLRPTARWVGFDESGGLRGVVEIAVPDGWHITPHGTSDPGVVGIDLTVEGRDVDVDYSRDDAIAFGPIQGAAGDSVLLTLRYQLCTKTECLPAEVARLRLVIPDRP